MLKGKNHYSILLASAVINVYVMIAEASLVSKMVKSLPVQETQI